MASLRTVTVILVCDVADMYWDVCWDSLQIVAERSLYKTTEQRM